MTDTIKQLLIHDNAIEIASADQAIEFDRFTIEDMGIDEKLLMENAGSAVARFVCSISRREATIMIFVGKGNNGADALVCARHLLARGFSPRIVMVFDEKTWLPSVGEQWAMLTRASLKTGYELPMLNVDDLDNFCGDNLLIVDGIFGAGINKEVSGIPLRAIDWINQCEHSVVVSIDIPSGLSLHAHAPPGACVKAHHTITFDYLKPAHISEPTKCFVGICHRAYIGLFNNSAITMFWLSHRRVLTELMLPFKATSHKGDFGHVLVYEGNEKLLGASRLAARAALRAGAGLVTIASASETPSTFDIAEFMRCKKDVDQVLSFFKKIHAFIVGPGLSHDEEEQKQALTILNKVTAPVVVIDGDALNLLNHHDLTMRHARVIATPHPKEAATLLGISTEAVECDRFAALTRLANLRCNNNNDIVWILKGASTLVRAQDGRVFVFAGDLPVLAVAGSGDVLAGFLAALVKQTSSTLNAALVGVSLQVAIGRQLSQKPRGLFASEICDAAPSMLDPAIKDDEKNSDDNS